MAAYADTSTSLLRSLARQLAGMRGSGHPSHAALLDVRAAHPRSQLHVRTVGDKITVWGDEGDESASGLAGGGPTAESQTASDVDLQELKSSIAAIVREYLQSGEAVEAIRRLRELNQTYYMHEFVKRLCVVAMDGGDSHVALASNLLDRAVGVNVLLPGVFTHGLQRLIAATDDLALDVPDAPRYVAQLVGDAVASGSVSADFFEELTPETVDAMLPHGAAAHARGLFEKHRAHFSSQQRAPLGPLGSTSELKAAVERICMEYLADGLGDVTEVQLKRLGAPHYLHELVLRLFVRAIERGERETSLASALTDRLSRHGVLGAETAKKGFTRLLQRCDDLALDVPRASAMVAEAIAQAISDGVLPTTFFSDLPADVTATFKRDGAADFARRLFSLFGEEAAAQHALSNPSRE